MRILSFLLKAAVAETAEEAANDTRSTLGPIADAVGDGFTAFYDRTTQWLSNATSHAERLPWFTAQRERADARWARHAGSTRPQLTAEERRQLQLLRDFKKEGNLLSKVLGEEIDDLRASLFKILLLEKIAGKIVKKNALDALCACRDWGSFSLSAQTALTDRKVVAGCKSRTRDLLQRIAESVTTKVDEAVSEEQTQAPI